MVAIGRIVIQFWRCRVKKSKARFGIPVGKRLRHIFQPYTLGPDTKLMAAYLDIQRPRSEGCQGLRRYER